MTAIRCITRLIRSERGQDLLEYGMLAALIAVVCYLAVESAGSAISGLLDGIATQVNALPVLGG